MYYLRSTPWLLLVGLVLFSQFSCSEDEDDVSQFSIEDYIKRKNLITDTTASGLHYIILNPGVDPKPNLTSKVTVTYKGYFLNDDVFNDASNLTFSLENLIRGWQEGLPLIGTGGSITILCPPELAYGSSGKGAIPPNTSIGFDIELISHSK